MVLRLSHVAKSYSVGGTAVEVLRDVSFDLGAGETLALEGESGSGKSTVLHLIAGLDAPTQGAIEVEGTEITRLSDTELAKMRRGTVGVIFQQFNLIPSLTVGANIAFHARLCGAFDPAWTDHLAARIGLEHHLEKYPEALSGGQQQRVAIARTLAARPRLILADEPTGNLDEDTADTVLALMLESAQEAGAAVLMVTHSARQAARMGRRLILSHGAVSERSAAGAGAAAAQ
ncbi:ABC transporter ATP-binding protein [Roseobacter weihaiensis]|uniref:ABC transporter ATP-binding protein n=1 Tax=Roseobacter weihaiensis TaxID=2763262 RepID=UPI001D0BDC3D|nr:ABC transporter ATP-binding protein [Roseobacter sp. H9]